ncbi:MAG: hypothetical protein CVV20_03130 [Gemmatimonadetes bacterium HGW-Gemmatimonadetes-1]|nr:MAG: hypothetical protein CVV20_03130 [Gemmatimonadetes bacterium HGW-Gemmatimonadetes-1]
MPQLIRIGTLEILNLKTDISLTVTVCGFITKLTVRNINSQSFITNNLFEINIVVFIKKFFELLNSFNAPFNFDQCVN